MTPLLVTQQTPPLELVGKTLLFQTDSQWHTLYQLLLLLGTLLALAGLFTPKLGSIGGLLVLLALWSHQQDPKASVEVSQQEVIVRNKQGEVARFSFPFETIRDGHRQQYLDASRKLVQLPPAEPSGHFHSVLFARAHLAALHPTLVQQNTAETILVSDKNFSRGRADCWVGVALSNEETLHPLGVFDSREEYKAFAKDAPPHLLFGIFARDDSCKGSSIGATIDVHPIAAKQLTPKRGLYLQSGY